jgi:4-amino-4-deoxy-L-arabinose transferase-like glycosyltransferase
MSASAAVLTQPRQQLVWFLLLLGLLLGPLLPRLSRFHGDECLYTDAAIQMVQTGDYWTPRYPDGGVRFLKPILSYWVLVTSYHVLGISYFSSRLPFLLAAGAMVWLTYRLGLRLLGSPSAALLAALILGSNTQFFALAIRSTPDALLCVFVLMSLLGFVRLLFAGDRSFAAYLLAYGGAGLAVQTKGLLGLCPAAFALGFAAVRAPPGTRLRDLLEARAIGIGLTIALFWYVVVFARHGQPVLAQFFSDQVTAKVAFSPLTCVTNLGVYGLAVLRHFLPWTLFLLIGLAVCRPALAGFFREHRRQCWFLAGWFLLLAVMFSFGSDRRTRYLAAAYPLLAILLAGGLHRCLETERFRRFFGNWLFGLAPILVGLAVFMGFEGWRIEPRLIVGATLLLATAAGLLWVVKQRRHALYGLALACVCVVAFGVMENFWRPLLSVVPAPALAARLLESNPTGGRVHAWNPASSYPNQIRVLSGGRLDVKVIETPPEVLPPAPEGFIVLSAAQKSRWTHSQTVFEEAGFASGKWSGKDLRALLFGPNPTALRTRHRTLFYVGTTVKPAGESR